MEGNGGEGGTVTPAGEAGGTMVSSTSGGGGGGGW